MYATKHPYFTAFSHARSFSTNSLKSDSVAIGVSYCPSSQRFFMYSRIRLMARRHDGVLSVRSCRANRSRKAVSMTGWMSRVVRRTHTRLFISALPQIVINRRMATPNPPSASLSTRTTSADYSDFIGSFANVNGYLTNKRMPTRDD
jgi:hypothetical protein